MSTGKVINITEGSNFTASTEPTWGPINGSEIAKSSKDYTSNDGAINSTGATEGRNNATLELAFPASVLGLSSYDPLSLYKRLLNPASDDDKDLALGVSGPDGAEQYMGTNYKTELGVAHLTFSNAPNLADVDTISLNIPSQYVPDVTAGAANAQGPGGYAAGFLTKYGSTSNAFPPAGAKPGTPEVATGIDLTTKGAAPTLSPSNTSSRLGDWLTPTLGRWQNDGTFERAATEEPAT